MSNILTWGPFEDLPEDYDEQTEYGYPEEEEPEYGYPEEEEPEGGDPQGPLFQDETD